MQVMFEIVFSGERCARMVCCKLLRRTRGACFGRSF